MASALIEPLSPLGLTSKQLAGPEDGELIEELRAGAGAVAVVTRDDALALSLKLLAGHVGRDIPLLPTLFDQTVAERR